jgi:2-methylisocitrate lyase-like PEP mutase family enzyme
VLLLPNMVERGDTPISRAADLETLGFRLVIFPGTMARVMAAAARDLYETIRRDGSTATFRDRMHDLTGLNDVIGLEEMQAPGRRYEDG